MSDAGWDKAVEGLGAVAHLASPFPPSDPKDEDELIRPAVDGTIRVLRAAVKGGVPRFVQTSSIAAIAYGFGPDRTAPFTEDDWTQLDGRDVSAYVKSKTLAERAARDFVAGDGKAIHYASVNPGFVLGPALDHDIGTSAEVIRMMLQGKYPGMARTSFGVVDVRDIASMHVKAVETSQPSGGRYMGASETRWLAEASRLLRARMGAAGRKSPTWQLPDFMVRLVGLFDPQVRGILPVLGRYYRFDNSRTRAELGMDFIGADDAILATATSLVELGLV